MRSLKLWLFISVVFGLTMAISQSLLSQEPGDDEETTVEATPEETREVRVWLKRPSRCLYITKVTRNSPAARAGLEKGDIIVAVDGNRVKSPEDLEDELFDQRRVRLLVINVRDDNLILVRARPRDDKLGIYVAVVRVHGLSTRSDEGVEVYDFRMSETTEERPDEGPEGQPSEDEPDGDEL